MNALTQVKNTQAATEKEAAYGQAKTGSSWHDRYSNSAYIFAGGLPFALTEGDLLAVFAQYGEVVDVNLVRDKETGKSRGFAFLAYEDQRSTILAVDNLNGAVVAGRTIRVEHVADYKRKREQVEGSQAVQQAMQRNAHRIAQEREHAQDQPDGSGSWSDSPTTAAPENINHVAVKRDAHTTSTSAHAQKNAASSEDATIQALKRRRENAESAAKRHEEESNNAKIASNEADEAADARAARSYDGSRVKRRRTKKHRKYHRRGTDESDD